MTDDMNAHQPQPSQQPNGEPNEHAIRQLSSAQTLITVCLISAPVSLLIGGALLSAVALICAGIAYSKVRDAIRVQGGEPSYVAARLRSQSRIAIIIAAITLVINIVYLIVIMPAVIEVMRTGDVQQLFGSLGASQQSSSSSASVWG